MFERFRTPQSTGSSSSNMRTEIPIPSSAGTGDYIPPATPEDMNDLLQSARSHAMMLEDPYVMNAGLAGGDSKIISLVRDMSLSDSSEDSITSPLRDSIVVGGVAIDEKPFGYRPMLGDFKLFAYKHKKPYFVV